MPFTKYVQEIKSTSTIDDSSDTILVDATTGSLTVNLPEIASDGMYFYLRRIDDVANNIATISAFSGNLIDGFSSATLDATGMMYIVSKGTNWYVVSGIGNSINRRKNDLQITFNTGIGTVVPYVTINSTSYTLITSFLYRGENYFGRKPASWDISYSLDSGSTPSEFTVQLQDITNIQNISSIVTSATTTDIEAISSTSFSNIPADESIIQINAKLGPGSSPANIRIYSIHIEFN